MSSLGWSDGKHLQHLHSIVALTFRYSHCIRYVNVQYAITPADLKKPKIICAHMVHACMCGPESRVRFPVKSQRRTV